MSQQCDQDIQAPYTSMIVNRISYIVKIVSKSKYLTLPMIIEIIKIPRDGKTLYLIFCLIAGRARLNNGRCCHRTVILVNKFFFILVQLPFISDLILFLSKRSSFFFFLYLFQPLRGTKGGTFGES